MKLNEPTNVWLLAADDHSLKVQHSTRGRALRFAFTIESSGWDICLEIKSTLPFVLLYLVM